MPSSIISRARTAIAKAIAPAHVARPSYPNLAAPRRYPDYNTARSSILGTEHNMGRSGLKYFYPGWIRNEPLSELQGAAKYLVFKEMGDMNGYCAAALNAFAMFLRRAKWRVDPVLDENKTNGSAQFLEECMEDMEHSWSTFIAQASRTVPQMGFCPFEIVYKLRAGENEDDPRLESKHDDGKIGWQTFAIRSPETVFHWVWYPDDPTRLRGLVQLTPPDYPSDLFIPVEKILLLRAEPGEDNPEGRSILRSSYKPFIVIRFMEDARNIIIEHAGTGIPKAELPPSITNPYSVDPVTGQPVLDDAGNPVVDPVSLATLNSVKESLMNMRLNEEPYIIVPSQFDENGHKLFDISFMTNNGGSMIGEINNTIKEEGMKILMSCMAEFLALGTNATGGGSFALSRDKTDNFSLAITSLLDLFQESINNQAVKRLFKLNPEFNLEVLPRIVHDPIVPININEVAAVLSGFKGIGWDLTKEANSEEIKNAILEAVGLPKAAKKDEANDEGEAKPEAKPGEGKPPEELKIPPVPETKAVKPEPLTEPGKVGKKAPFVKWDESEHPREDDGKFTDGGGSASSANAKTSSAPTITSDDIGDVLDGIRSRTSDEYYNLSAIYDADEADQKYFIDTTKGFQCSR